MISLLFVLGFAQAQEGAEYENAVEIYADEVHIVARPLVYGIEVPRPQARLDWFEADELHANGWTVDLWFLARGANGGPVNDLELYLSANTGELGPLAEHGNGLYSVTYTPPRATHWAELIIRAKGITPDNEGISVVHQRWMLPADEPRRMVEANRRRPSQRRPHLRNAPAIAASE